MKAVAVLGAGPAGLMAVHACALTGQPVVLFSKGEKSKLGGAQFLHEPIPELTDDEPEITITYRRVGSGLMYQAKAYGSGTQPPFVSFDGVEDGLTQAGWNLRKLYDRLWDTYAGQITGDDITPKRLREILDDSLFSVVVSSIPLPAVCANPSQFEGDGRHRFTSQAVVIQNGVCNGGADENTIWYNGMRDVSWYRCSNLWGVRSTERGLDTFNALPYEISGAVQVRKPLHHSCDCWVGDPKLVQVGRFGRWQKGVLVHDGFRTTVAELAERGLFELPERIRP